MTEAEKAYQYFVIAVPVQRQKLKNTLRVKRPPEGEEDT